MSSNSLDLNMMFSVDEVAVNAYNSIEIISNSEDFFALREQWNKINENSSNGNIFVSWEWLYTWWETYQKQGTRTLYILKCTDINNQLLGIAPFQIINNPKKYFPCSRQLVMLGTGETDGSLVFGEYMDLVIKQGHETAVICAISSFLSKHNNLWDGIKFQQQLIGSHLLKLFPENNNSNLSTGSHNSKLNESPKIASEEGYYFFENFAIKKVIRENGFRTIIDLPETYNDYLMSLRKKMRNNITRIYSRLNSEQEFTITSATTESEIEAQIANKDVAIEILAKLNRTRRGDSDKNSVFEKPSFELFHKRLLKRLMPLNKVSLNVLKFGNEPVAALYSFIDRGTVHAYQSGFETVNGHRYSLLTTMLSQEISKSIEDENVSRFNFMYADEESTYKRRYSGNTEPMFDISYDKQSLKQSTYNFIHGPIKECVKKLLNKA